MAVAQLDRRMLAVLAADVVGYSRLMEADEPGTIARLKTVRAEIADPLIARHHGRLVKLMGDGALVVFESVVDAVTCAVELQRAVAARNTGRPEAERIVFRIGVNLGDVVLVDGDVYGDGVNVAARLEQMCDPGGVVVSGTAYDQLHGKLELPLDFAGEQQLKNIARPVRAYRVRLDGGGRRRLSRRWLRSRPSRASLALVAAAILALGGVVSWWAATAPPPRTPALAAEPARLSVVVLPFANLSGDPGQDYFADGLTDDVTGDLSRIDDSFVIARHTAFTYKGRTGINLREVGRELGVRYVLEGSVQRAGNRVHLNLQLIDAVTGGTLWAERLEGTLDRLAALEAEVTGRIAATLRLELIEAEGRRLGREHRNEPEALDDAIRGWALLERPYSQENVQEARRLFERALATDPNTVSALTGLAYVLVGRGASPASRERASALLRRALDLEPDRAAVHFVLGQVRRSQGRFQEAVDAFRTAIALDPNYARAYTQLGATLLTLGRSEEAIPLAERAIRLSPRDPNIGECFFLIGRAHLLAERLDEAIRWLEKGRSSSPRLWYIHLTLAAAYGLAHRLDDAKQELAEHLRLRPEFSSLAAIRAAMPQSNYPAFVEQSERTIYVGLRRAGMPNS